MIISVLLQFLTKIDRQELKPAVWKGAFVGLFGAIAIGVCFIIAFYETNEQFFTGDTEYIVEAILVSCWVSLRLDEPFYACVHCCGDKLLGISVE